MDFPEIASKLLMLLILTVIVGAITDLIITGVIIYLKLEISTIFSQMLVEGPLQKTQEGLMNSIVPLIDLVIGVAGAVTTLSWFETLSGGGN